MTVAMIPARKALVVTCFGAMAVAAALAFGPLNPPGGAVSSTYKTLSEVEPRIAVNAANTPGDDDALLKITQSGSYYLVGNIVGVVGKHGIEIAASDVTLDLNGFELAGVPGMGFFSGVTVNVSGLTNIAVVNGSVNGWGGEAGVDLLGVFGATNCRVERVFASGNSNVGIRLGGVGLVTNCSAYLNTGIGISMLSGGTISSCSSVQNTSSGISVGTGCMVVDCVSRLNTLDGIRCANDCVIRENICTGNGNGAGSGAGVHVTGSRNRIEGNHCTNADRGVDVDAAGNFIIRNTCSAHATNWDIVANNYFGPIINRAGAATAGYTGDGIGTGTIATTDPHANFTY